MEHTEPAQDRLEVARRLLARGIIPVPVQAGSKRPAGDGWQSRVPTAAELPTMFQGPGNIGILLGEPSGGIADIDLDCVEAVELADKFLPPTAVVTGRPGNPRSHRWYRAVGALTRQFRDPVTREMILELRSTGGQTLVGPSVHPESGERYEDFDGEPAEVDAGHLLHCAEALYRAVVQRRYPEGVELVQNNPVPNTRRSSSADEHRVYTRDPVIIESARRYLKKMPPAVSGQGGHARLYAAATCLVHGFGLEPSIAFDLLKQEFNPRCEPTWSDKELWHKIDDAAKKPHGRPFRWLADAVEGVTTERARTKSSHAVPESPTLRECTDLGNAELFAQLYLDQVRYCGERKCWYSWCGTHWTMERGGAPLNLAGEMVKRLVSEPQLMRGIAPVFAFGWPKKCESLTRLNAIVKLAEAQPSLGVSITALDADQWVFNVANGTIDLKTGTLRPHRPSDLITRCSPVTYEPGASCPRFCQFLNEVFDDDQELIGYVLRLLGHCLTGDVREEYLHIFHGDGNNGKSVLIDTVLHIFGAYGNVAPPTLLTQKRRSEHPTELAELRGKRLVAASETEKGEPLKVEQLKRLTGDAYITARLMHENFSTFPRQCKVILATNNMVRVAEDTTAVRRRLRVVPFDVIIPESRRDNTLREVLRREASGILALLVQGCLEWQSRGLKEMPDAMRRATAAHGWTKDLCSEFVEECFERVNPGTEDGEGGVPWKIVWEMHREWAARTQVAPMSEHALQRALSDLGFASVTRREGPRTVKVRTGLWPKACQLV